MAQLPLSVHDIANRLNKPRRRGPNSYLCCCPAHDDNNPSLSIAAIDGKILVYCFSGCSQDEVIEALTDLGLWNKPEARDNPVRLNQKDLIYAKTYVALAKQEKNILPKEAALAFMYEKALKQHYRHSQ